MNDRPIRISIQDWEDATQPDGTPLGFLDCFGYELEPTQAVPADETIYVRADTIMPSAKDAQIERLTAERHKYKRMVSTAADQSLAVWRLK